MEERFHFVSLFDLGFALLFIFLFAFTLVNTYNGKIEENKANLLQKNIGEKELFNEGEFVFKDSIMAKEIIKKYIVELYDIWKKEYYPKPIKHILVIGHTDNIPISSKLKKKYHNPNYSNWNLSLDRANQVVQLIIKENLLEDKEGLSIDKLVPQGKSYYYPAPENVIHCIKKMKLLPDTLSLSDIPSDKLWKFIRELLTQKEIEGLIKCCNATPEMREKNRRMEIRLELWPE